MKEKKKVLIVFGTRPEAIKMAPVVREFKKHSEEFITKVYVTAQHREMLDDVLEVFSIKPDHDINVMQKNQSLFYITSEVLKRSEGILDKEKPDMVLVHGDTTTTFTVALAAFYKKIPVGHVEAGLRSYDKYQPFPEEINRVLGDSLAALHFAPTGTCKKALLKENTDKSSIYITGNTVIDALHTVLKEIKSSSIYFVGSPKCILVTAHRRENFGKPFSNIFNAIKRVAERYPKVNIIYPVHMSPNVQEPANRILGNTRNVILFPPLNYSDFSKLIEASCFVVTDSGGLQEEAPSLGKPVLVLRNVTERPEAVSSGTVRIIGTDEERVFKEMCNLLDNKKHYDKMAKAVNPYGDGKAAYRTLQAVRHYFGFRKDRPKDFTPK
ncbi:MAG: UDP-N-acetylglucosamine 2-epimerase (non-hydrolyzing) [Elusimicrobia bacterium]|nr:UDP-N-acetylglucosamine 2-epimerase (non-hydrolyzing) [Candidatus Liberimonas magnetica]